MRAAAAGARGHRAPLRRASDAHQADPGAAPAWAAGRADAAAALHRGEPAGQRRRAPRTSCSSSPPGSAATCRSCLTGSPLALAWGTGERLLRLPPLPARRRAAGDAARRGSETGGAYGWVDAARQSAGRRGAVALDLDALSTLGRHRPHGRQRLRVAGLRARARDPRGLRGAGGTRPLLCRMSGLRLDPFRRLPPARDRDDARMMLGSKARRGWTRSTTLRRTPGPGRPHGLTDGT